MINAENFKRLSRKEKQLYLEENFKKSVREGSGVKVKGFGVNDSKYSVNVQLVGGRARCPAYTAWCGMMERCYNHKNPKNLSYKGCTISEDWRLFSVFLAWWKTNHVEGWQLDKDVLLPDNKVYGPTTCRYIPNWVNSFLAVKARDGEKLGAFYHKKHKKYRSACYNPLTNKQEYVGWFSTEEEASAAYLSKKKEHLLGIKEELDRIDSRIYENFLFKLNTFEKLVEG